MSSIDTASARRHLADLVSRVLYTKERITLTRYGKACAVLVPVEDLARLDEPAVVEAKKPSLRRSPRLDASPSVKRKASP